MDEDKVREYLGRQLDLGVDVSLGLLAGAVAGLPGAIVTAYILSEYKHAANQAHIEAENRAHTFEVIADSGRARMDPEFTPPPLLPDPATVLRDFEEIFSGSIEIGLDYADPDSVDFTPQKDASLAAQAMNMGPEEFLRWMTMARPVAYGSNRDPGEVLTDMIEIWSGPGQELDVAARAVDVITDDLDALDRMALSSNDPAMRAILAEAQSHAFLTSGFNRQGPRSGRPVGALSGAGMGAILQSRRHRVRRLESRAGSDPDARSDQPLARCSRRRPVGAHPQLCAPRAGRGRRRKLRAVGAGGPAAADSRRRAGAGRGHGRRRRRLWRPGRGGRDGRGRPGG